MVGRWLPKAYSRYSCSGRVFFVGGILMNVFLGPAFDIAGYAFAPAPVIAPFTGFNVAFNTFLAPYSLGEKLTGKRLLSAFIVFVTATLSIVFKKENREEKWTVEHSKEVLFRYEVLLYCMVFALWLLLNVLLQARCAHGSVVRGFSLGAAAGSLAGNMWYTRVAAGFGADCLAGAGVVPAGYPLPDQEGA